MTNPSGGPDAVVGLAMTLQAAPGRFALLVGSGISYPSGIPTGWAVVADIAGKVAVADGEDSVPEDPVGWYAERYGAAPEYSDLLAAVAPTTAQRRDLLTGYFEPTAEDREAGLKAPTAAHRAIASLVARGTVRVIVTTNFDRLLEQAIQAEGIEPVVVASAAAAAGTIPLAHTACTIIKVHGDYLDPNVKNTVGELEAYEPALDALLDRAFDDYGLVVCGWSGTWDPALRRAIERSPSRRYGTYWAAHGGTTPEADQLIANRYAEVISIDGADSFFDGLLHKIEALDDLRQRAGGAEVAAAQAKRYLPEPALRIKLHDLAMDAADRALAGVDFDGNPASAAYEDYLEKAAELRGLSAELIAVAGVLAQFGDRTDHTELLCRVIAVLESASDGRNGGYTSWLNLRRYPALLALYSTGVAAVAGDNWNLLAGVLATGLTGPGATSGGPSPVLDSLAIWNVLDHDAVNSSFGSPGRKTPNSDYLFEHLANALAGQLRTPADRFAQVFDEWEYLLGVAITGRRGRGPIGRFAWKHMYAFEERTPARALEAASPQLLAAGLFMGSEADLATARETYDEFVRRSGLAF